MQALSETREPWERPGRPEALAGVVSDEAKEARRRPSGRLSRLRSAKARFTLAGEVLVHPLNAPPGHFRSPLVGAQDVSWAMSARPALAGIDMRTDAQLALVRELSEHWDGFFDQLRPTDLYQPAAIFPAVDAAIYASVLMHARSRRVVEVGSGYSSALALDLRRKALPELELTFIEPYPEERLDRLVVGSARSACRIISRPVQEVPLSTFDELDNGDMVFIDGSHIVKAGSDTAWMLLNVLPRLRSGVRVHIHDVFWPFEYPSTWLRDGRSFNEAYFVRAFLAFNEAFDIDLFANWAWREHPEEFDKLEAHAGAARPTSLYLRRR
jgi:hypothetical protein